MARVIFRSLHSFHRLLSFMVKNQHRPALDKLRVQKRTTQSQRVCVIGGGFQRLRPFLYTTLYLTEQTMQASVPFLNPIPQAYENDSCDGMIVLLLSLDRHSASVVILLQYPSRSIYPHAAIVPGRPRHLDSCFPC